MINFTDLPPAEQRQEAYRRLSVLLAEQEALSKIQARYDLARAAMDEALHVGFPLPRPANANA